MTFQVYQLVPQYQPETADHPNTFEVLAGTSQSVRHLSTQQHCHLDSLDKNTKVPITFVYCYKRYHLILSTSTEQVIHSTSVNNENSKF